MNGIKSTEIDLFFKEIENTETHQTLTDKQIEILNAFERIIGHSFCIVDYHLRRFVYVSSNSLFLCGYKADDVLKMGYAFYRKIVVEDDLKLLMEVDKKGYELFNRLSVEDKMKSTLSFDYRIKQPGGNIIMVNEKNTPLALTKDNEVRYALCIVSVSLHDTPGHMVVNVNDKTQYYKYSFETKRWKTAPATQLSKREKEILLLATQGYPNEAIANALFINISTVKFHKTNIYSKLKVKNITEAIACAYLNKLL